MNHRMAFGLSQAGGSIETGKRAKVIEKACGACGCSIPFRKTYCGPCYHERLMKKIADGRLKYRKVKV